MSNTIPRLIFVTCLSLLQCYFGIAGAETSQATKPNMIFIMADDLGKLLLPIYGAKPVIKMPHIKQLAEEGVVFQNTYATYLCSPTRAKLISGRSSLNTGASTNLHNRTVTGGRATGFYKYLHGNDAVAPFIDPQYIPSFAMPLKQSGYTTAIIGKWHLGNDIKHPRIFRTFGFDRWMISNYALHQAIGAVTDEGLVLSGGFMPEKMTDFIIEFIKQNKEKPFFVYYPMHLPHAPFTPTPLHPDAETREEMIIAMIEYIDFIVGRIMKTLTLLDLKDQTIIFFSTDNGDAIDYRTLYELIQGTKAKYFRGKGSVYEGGINVPFIVGGGPVIKRKETEALVDFTDILPTLADFAGVPIHRRNRENSNDYRGIANQYISVAGQYKGDGYSIAPFLTGQAADTPRDWIMFPGYSTVIRDKRFKLWAKLKNHQWPRRGQALYDLYNDPNEINNLYHSNEPAIHTAKRRLEHILMSIPKGSNINQHFDPIDWNYGITAHWTMDRPKLSNETIRLVDAEGGYDAESDSKIVFNKHGKFAEALAANQLYAPSSEGIFYNFIKGSNIQHHLHYLMHNRIFFGSRTLYRGLHKILKNLNYTSLEIVNAIYSWMWTDTYKYIPLAEDREKYYSSMTVSAWVHTQRPKRDLYLLEQPYIDDEGHLMRFSITADSTVNFELTTNDETRHLESNVLDEHLWEQWMHISATWDGRDNCGKAILYINGEQVAATCLGRPLSANDTDNLLLGGFTQEPEANDSDALVDDIAIWRQPLMPVQIKALYSLGDRFAYNASQVDTLFNTPENGGVTKIRDHLWQRITLKDISDAEHLIIRELPDAVEVQFGEVMAIRSSDI